MMLSREEALQRGDDLPEEGEVFDSNCITPGTVFMDRLSRYLEHYIADRLTNDPLWRGIVVRSLRRLPLTRRARARRRPRAARGRR